MARYAVQFSEECGVELDVWPGAPALKSLELKWTADSEAELRELIGMCGGLEAFHVGANTAGVFRWGVPLTRDGETVGHVTVAIMLGPGLRVDPAPPPRPPVLTLLMQERAAVLAR